VGKQQN